MDIIISLHSKLAYVVLIFLVLATLNAFWGLIGKRRFGSKDLRLSLFALIFSHIQLLIGLQKLVSRNQPPLKLPFFPPLDIMAAKLLKFL